MSRRVRAGEGKRHVRRNELLEKTDSHFANAAGYLDDLRKVLNELRCYALDIHTFTAAYGIESGLESAYEIGRAIEKAVSLREVVHLELSALVPKMEKLYRIEKASAAAQAEVANG